MRLKIDLKAKNNFKVPFNYNHILSSIIYSKIKDSNLADELHSLNSYKFFNFSQLDIPKRKVVNDGIISRNGVISFYLSSPDDLLVENLVNGFVDDMEVRFGREKMAVTKIEALKAPQFSEKSEFKTLSPIIVRDTQEINGKLKRVDLAPCDKFFKGVEANLVKKYCKYNGLESTDKEISVYSEMAHVKRKRIMIPKGPNTTYHRAYMMDLILEGNKDLIDFAYDVGLGEKNSMGFGMIYSCC
ncbi:CRISPR-associated endoribonuclease Cas6 [Methanobrevibacter millerae]|uniref:CRISPR-associated endoribonuclease n=1 Tax=Methanobrevibacter millerae TaxID=230361 RepID=A0A1G5VGY9_9EURY|nr:CRISPR-associated endoribonuclease Cas6 [Methanobrevibacter millerae]SDA45181.1 CRISPR-associated endoribonuclease Cas6 [Methanobrevibacter millerae]